MHSGGAAASPYTTLVGTYDYVLVALSVVIAIMAAYAALDLARRVTFARGRARILWLARGATAMGFGIWSMHYMGMLAFRLPVPVQYDWPTVVWSLVAAIAASAVALLVVSRPRMSLTQALLGQRVDGRRHRRHALHRHGGDANAGDVQLLTRPGRAIRAARDCDLTRGPVAHLSFP